MNQEKFIGTYIELLNSTLSEAIQKNLTTLAHKNVLEIELNELKNSVNNTNDSLKRNLDEKDKQIFDLKNQLNEARKLKELATGENNELKKNVQHIDTFKNELVKTRNELNKLTTDYSQLKAENEKLHEENNIKTLKIISLTEEVGSNKTISSEVKNKKLEKTFKLPVKKSVEKGKEYQEIQQELQKETFLVKDAGNF